MRYARNPEVLWRRVGDRIALRPAADPSPTGASEATGAAALVWLCLEEPASLEELQADIAAAGASPVPSLGEALTMLAERNLIVPLDR